MFGSIGHSSSGNFWESILKSGWDSIKSITVQTAAEKGNVKTPLLNLFLKFQLKSWLQKTSINIPTVAWVSRPTGGGRCKGLSFHVVPTRLPNASNQAARCAQIM